MKKRFTFICTMIMAVLALGLFGQTRVYAQGASSDVTSSEVTVTITTDKEEYQAGEEIQYTITVENNRKHWKISALEFKYSNTEGLVPVSEDSMPNTLDVIEPGTSVTLTGKLIGDEAVFGKASVKPGNTGNAGNGNNTSGGKGITTYVIWAVIGTVLGAAVFIIVRGILKKKSGKTDTSGKDKSGKGPKGPAAGILIVILAASCLASNTMPVEAAESDNVTIRPYLKFTYAGQEVMIRAVMELEMVQKKSKIPSEYASTVPKITCHDPSIFRDFDGRYYIFGSFLAGGYTDNLRNWTSIDSEFQGSFTQEVRDEIKAYNADSGSWNGYLWAPDIIYNPEMGKYCMYLSANGDHWTSNIVLLTADTVDGPYEYAGSVVYGGFTEENYYETDVEKVTGEATIAERYTRYGVANNRWGDMYPNCIDPCVFYDEKGNLWMSYGSWSGGIFMLELDETTGLRDYSVSYQDNIHSDPYFGTKIAGGAYVSGEASYIQYISGYYYLFISYGNLEAKGGYNIRVYRSTVPNGNYVDALGNTPYYDSYTFNYNQSKGVRLFGGYKWRTFNNGQVAQGHNSAFTDADGKSYIVFHTRTTDGTEGHYVKVHQLFVNKEGWLVAAPYATNGETLNESGYKASEIAGDYDVILHELDIDYKNLETNKTSVITLNEDGTITGAYEGSYTLESGTPYINLNIDGITYSGVLLKMYIENSTLETYVFTALGIENQITLWGSMCFD